jgi:hypothetical protein
MSTCRPGCGPLSEKTREAVRRNVAAAPPLTDRQRERLRLLFADLGHRINSANADRRRQEYR